MRSNLLLGTLIGTLILCPLIAWAQGALDLPALGSRTFTRDFDERSITCEVSLRIKGNYAAGERVVLYIDLDSAITGGESDELPRAVVLNGFVTIALPRGLEPEAKLRLYYFDGDKGSYEFMYSKAYPNLTKFSGLEEAIERASRSDPSQILSGLSDLSKVLEPAVVVRGPTDPRLGGADPDYAVYGISWLIPCNVFYKEVVDPFDPQDSLVQNARLRIGVPLRVGAQLPTDPVVVYAGGLSTGVARVELLPGEIPPTAMPLAPVPGAKEAATEADAGQSAGNAAEESGAESAPADGAAAEVPEPPPAKIPTLVFSYEWIAWETQVDLGGRPAGLPAPTLEDRPIAPFAAPAPNSGDTLPPAYVGPGDSSESEPQPPESGESVEINGGPGSTDDPRNQPIKRVPLLVPPTPATPPAPSTPPAPPPADENEYETMLSRQDTPGVTEVAPGTLPTVEEHYTLSLKPLTGAHGASGQGEGSATGFFSGVPVPGATDSGQPGGLPPVIRYEGPGGAGSPAGVPFTPPADLGTMVLVPEGNFLMGTDSASSAGDADELPQAQIHLPAYYIDKYPVTNRQFHNFVISAGYKPDGNWQKYYTQGTPDMPVRGVSWHDAQAYARWAGKRLPSEAEWEKAARGDDGRTYPWGNEWSSDILPRGEYTHRLITAEQAASPYGVMAMAGVLWQWTASAYAPYPFNPDARGKARVLRGGCFSNGRNIIRCANRYHEPPNVALNTFGFRCVKDAAGGGKP